MKMNAKVQFMAATRKTDFRTRILFLFLTTFDLAKMKPRGIRTPVYCHCECFLLSVAHVQENVGNYL